MELIFGTLGLARRLEAAEAKNAAGFAHASGNAALSIAAGEAAFVGVGSPLTHAVGIGMAGPVSDADLDRLEEFYRVRDTAVVLDVCPLADPSLHQLLGERGYRITEFNNVLVRRLEPGASFHEADFVRRAQTAEEDAWTRTVARGFFERDQMTLDEQILTSTIFGLDSGACWLASVDETPAAAAAIAVEDGVGTFFADSTITTYRRRGLQSALIQARLAYAVERGCDLVTASTMPGSSSQFNYERLGFRVIYTKYIMARNTPI
ncbi:MAG: GNAT family N-acetyltransferase [Acidobacteriota bacterium]|nr:GNAT family N-acetyltransferase [Acidobacteriota bacterium]